MNKILLFILGLTFLITSRNNKASIRTDNIQYFDKNISECTWKENYNAIMLYGFLNEGINKNNILLEETKSKIQTVLIHYHNMDDFNTKEFYIRESANVNKMVFKDQYELYNLCIHKLSFEDVLSSEELEENWRYPIDQIKSLKNVYDLYKEDTVEDGIFTEVPYLHMYLYMYLASSSERENIFKEIDLLKMSIQKNIR